MRRDTLYANGGGLVFSSYWAVAPTTQRRAWQRTPTTATWSARPLPRISRNWTPFAGPAAIRRRRRLHGGLQERRGRRLLDVPWWQQHGRCGRCPRFSQGRSCTSLAIPSRQICRSSRPRSAYDSLHGSQDGFIVPLALILNRLAASAGNWLTLALLGALLLGLGTRLQRGSPLWSF